jgi:hypothetical protein
MIHSSVPLSLRLGWSTSIPNFNPIEIVENLRRLMRGEEPERMNPWFRGFRVGCFPRTICYRLMA